MTAKQKPSLWWLATAPLIFFLGVFGGTALIVWQAINLNEGDPFIAPSIQTINIEQAGTYALWNDYKINYNGKIYSKPEDLPDQTTISLKINDKNIKMLKSWNSSSASGQHEKLEVGRYCIEVPGTYILEISGLTEDRVFSFGRSNMSGLLWAAVSCLILNLLGWLGAPAIIIIVMVKRNKGEK